MSATTRESGTFYILPEHSLTFVLFFVFTFFFFIIPTESSPKNCISVVNRFERSLSLFIESRTRCVSR